MAVAVDTLKLTQTHGVFRVRGTAATGTITLSTLLKKSTEDTPSSPKVNIKAIHWALSSSARAIVRRNSVDLFELQVNGKLDFYGFSDDKENGSDIEIVISGGNGGSVIVECAKISGYGPYSHQDQGTLG